MKTNVSKIIALIAVIIIAGTTIWLISNKKLVEKTFQNVFVKETITEVEDEYDIQTSERLETIKHLTNEELFWKLYLEVGTDAIELWMTVYCTDFELSDESLALFKKTDDIIQNNFVATANQHEVTWEFYRFVAQKGYEDEYQAWHFKSPEMSNNTAYAQNKNQSNRNKSNRNQTMSLNEAIEISTELMSVQQNTKPKKDFSHTRYSDDFCSKYSLKKKYIKTDADKTFNQKWDIYLRLIANYLQQYVYGYDYIETKGKALWLEQEIKDYASFLSQECLIESYEKIKEATYKITEVEKSKRL